MRLLEVILAFRTSRNNEFDLNVQKTDFAVPFERKARYAKPMVKFSLRV